MNHSLFSIILPELIILVTTGCVIGVLAIWTARRVMLRGIGEANKNIENRLESLEELVAGSHDLIKSLAERTAILEHRTIDTSFLLQWKVNLVGELDQRYVSADTCFFKHATPEQIAAVQQERKRIMGES